MAEQYQSALTWAKAHKKAFIEKLIADSGAEPQDSSSAIFYGGSTRRWQNGTIKKPNQSLRHSICADRYGSSITIDIVIKRVDNKISEWIRNADLIDFDNKLNIEHNKNKLVKYIQGE